MISQTLSFAGSVKEELSKLDRSDEAKRSLLSGYAKAGGSVTRRNGTDVFSLHSERSSVANMLYRYIKELYGVEPYFSYTRESGFGKRVVYHVNLSEEMPMILGDLEVELFKDAVPPHMVASKELSSGYLSGCFLSGGSVNSPKSSNYHLEMVFENKAFAKSVVKVINTKLPYPFSAKLIERRRQFVVYMKKSQDIADFLAFLGATENTLAFEDVRLERDYLNVNNRLYNLDGANMGKTIKASARQIEEINYFETHGGLKQFGNEKMETLLELRKAHEDASLEELSVYLSEALATEISKSNVNHLFRRLHQAYLEETGNGKG